MSLNLTNGDDPTLIHPVSTSSWLIVPAFLLVTVPILWRRGNVTAVVAATAAAVALHVLAFGWVTRCGVVIPLAAALAYAVARFANGTREHVLGLAGIVVTEVIMLWRDSSAGLADALPFAIAPVVVFYALGWLVKNQLNRRQPADQRATV
ncbi:hypothetical protein Ait01nite_036770 [Actinoplanes italicus]|nr:hypothetical protein Ait01nite_036770 [Actinoplanes italicus]